MTTNPQHVHYLSGAAAGAAAGSWIIDGNTTAATAAAILSGIDEGDPATMDLMPAPLSGEWAGESPTELLGEDYTDDDADEYERGFEEGFWDAVTIAAQHAAQVTR